MPQLQLDEIDMVLIGYALEVYSVHIKWEPIHKEQIINLLNKVKEIQVSN